MKVLCEYTDCGPAYVRSGWGKVFAALGHEFVFWRPEVKPAFDVFAEFEPDLFIGTTYGVDRAIVKCIHQRPQMRVILFASAWGDLVKDLDREKYPLVIATEQEKRAIEFLKKQTGRPDFVFVHVTDRFLDGTMGGWREIGVTPHGILNAADTFDYSLGQFREELSCDVAFVGGYWPYKARNLDRFLLPLCQDTGLNVKIFGNQPWPVPQYLGNIDTHLVRDLFCSTKVCLNVSEPHSTDLGWDVIERPFKVLSSGGFCLSDYVEEAVDVFEGFLPMAKSPDEMYDLTRYYIGEHEQRGSLADRGRDLVLRKHTYFHRVAKMFDCLGLESEAAKCLSAHSHLTAS